MHGLDQNGAKKPPQLSQALVRPPVVATAPALARPRWRALLDIYGVVRVRFWVLSLSVEEGIFLPLVLWQEFGPNFKGLTKVSRVTTNYWIFLRCDYSPVSS